MADLSIPARIERTSAAAFLVCALEGAGWSLERLARAQDSLADFLPQALPPSTESLGRLFWKMAETLQIALAGPLLGMILSPPVAFLAVRGPIAGPAVNMIAVVVIGLERFGQWARRRFIGRDA